MATLDTSMLSNENGNLIPGTSLGVIVERASRSTLAQLSPEKPTLFGPVHGATFAGTPKAQVVGESEAKLASDVSLVPFKADPIKVQTSVRVSDEFLWADNDYRLQIIDEAVAPAIGDSISRAVDLLAYHGVNPYTGQVTTKMPKYLAQATNVVTAADKPTSEVIEAVGLVMANGGVPNGIAFDSGFGFGLATEINPVTGAELNPGMGFGGDLSSFKGIRTATGSTVSGRPEIDDSGIRAIVGDYSQVRWGFQRRIPLALHTAGNPDNVFDESGKARDLAGHNEVLLRAEAVIYIAVGNLARFSLVQGSPESPASPGSPASPTSP